MRRIPQLVLRGLDRAAGAPGGTGIAGRRIRQVLFEDVTAGSGIRFILHNSASPQKHQIETMPGGVAVFDFDNDGLPDIFFTNGAAQPSLTKSGPAYSNRLYRNKGNFQFEDVTEKAGVGGAGYDIGAAAADYDNDGNVDLFVVGVNHNTLFHNRGDGTFEDVTRKAGLGSTDWSVSAAWLDYDNDGKLDLFVVYYVGWDPAHEPWCGTGTVRTYCHPRFYEPLAQPPVSQQWRRDLYRRFIAIRHRGVARQRHGSRRGGLRSRRLDGYFRRQRFRSEFAVSQRTRRQIHGGRHARGGGVNDDGIAVSSMGVDFRDLDNDGNEDFFITALASERFSFSVTWDAACSWMPLIRARSGRLSRTFSGWSTGVFDFDNDGWKDIFVACGDVQDNTDQYSDRKPREPNLLLLNQRNGTFDRSCWRAGDVSWSRVRRFRRRWPLDAIVTRLNEPRGTTAQRDGHHNHWLNVRLKGRASNRDGIGARVILKTQRAAGESRDIGRRLCVFKRPGSPFRTGAGVRARQLDIEWPSGRRQVLRNVAADRLIGVGGAGYPLGLWPRGFLAVCATSEAAIPCFAGTGSENARRGPSHGHPLWSHCRIPPSHSSG